MELHIAGNFQQKLRSISKFIGSTPLYPLPSIIEAETISIHAKLEWQQFGGSVKSRPAFNIIKDAVNQGQLRRGKILLDASSGNTAVAYASIGAALGISVAICLPANASLERKQLLAALGAEIIYTSELGSTDEAQEKASELFNRNPERYFYADQYNNDSNWKAHYDHTAEEIWEQTKGQVTHFVTGLGTTGSFSGISKRLKERNPAIRTIALQPDSAMHILEGWKHLETAKTPGIIKHAIIDETIEVDSYEALEMIKRVASKEGLLISPSSAANLVGAEMVAKSAQSGVIVTLFPDNAEKYSDVLKSIYHEQ
ncbi:MAG: cysteine synthase family protein [Bacteroidota bacterium]